MQTQDWAQRVVLAMTEMKFGLPKTCNSLYISAIISFETSALFNEIS
jgi:hypothetical protein